MLQSTGTCHHLSYQGPINGYRVSEGGEHAIPNSRLVEFADDLTSNMENDQQTAKNILTDLQKCRRWPVLMNS
ncbi:hypothetical protein ScPMuIL_000678 [Solemya velum]